MGDKTLYEMHADVCKALAHSVRIEIIDILKSDELTFGNIAKQSGVAKSNLAQHLAVMVNKGLLLQRKEGLYVYYRLSSSKVYKAFKLMKDVLKERIQKHRDIYKKIKF